VRIEGIVPENKFVNRIEQFEFLFEQPEPSFNFPVGLWGFHPVNDMIDVAQVEELLERMVGIAIPYRCELGIVVGQDLARGSVFTEPLVQDRDGVFCCWRIEYPVAGN
jgi:hypothetical protein